MIQEGQTARLNEKLNNLVTLSISSDPNADLYINNTKAGRTPYAGVLLAGTYDIRLQAYGHHDLTKKITIDHQHDKYYFHMKRQYYYKDDFVFGANVSTNLNDLRVGGYAGVYLNGFYLEGDFQYGLTTSETVYWYDKIEEDASLAYTYRPIMIGLKTGYGLIAGIRLRFTPNLGIGYTILKGKPVNEPNVSFNPSVSSVLSVSGGMKLSYAITSCVEMNVSSDYNFLVSKSDLYNIIYNTAPRIKTLNEGLDLSIGIGLYF
jgi:hypothetical protein